MEYVVTSYYKTPAMPRAYVHAWGPYGSRREARNARDRMRRSQKRDDMLNGCPDSIANGTLTLYVGPIMDPEGVTRNQALDELVKNGYLERVPAE